MRRIVAFLLLFGVSLGWSLTAALWYNFASAQTVPPSMTDIMRRIMGAQGANVTFSPIPPYFWIALAALVSLTVAGLIGTVYYAVFPELDRRGSVGKPSPEIRPQDSKVSWETLLRTLKPDEKKVLEILATHGGKHLQKLIVKEAGFSKLKTHRVVARLAERGIVTLARSGNTNEVSLSEWLKPRSEEQVQG